MTGYGCVCDWCGESYEAEKWGQPFWCPTCLESRIREHYKDFRPRYVQGAA